MIGTTMADTTNMTITITKAQRRALRAAITKDKTNKSLSKVLRGCMENYVKNQGLEWPEDESNWGGERPKKNK